MAYKYFDFSIHFTLKEQSLDSIKEKLRKWYCENVGTIDLTSKDRQTVMHHCFLPREIVIENAYSTSLVDMLDTITKTQVRWYNAGIEGLTESRWRMFENLKRVGGVAIFIGDIKEGVKEELEIANEKCIPVIHVL